MAGTTTQIRAGVVIAGRYRVIDRLGHGGMATVFLAEDQVLSRQVAVKRLHTAAAEGAPSASSVRPSSGRRSTTRTSSPSTTRSPGPDGVLIVMEYVPGQPLSELIAAGARGAAVRRSGSCGTSPTASTTRIFAGWSTAT